MTTQRIRTFDKALRCQARPRLATVGFQFDERRTFRRTVPHGFGTSTHIVEFQIGLRSLAGRFTVNIGVFNANHHKSLLHVSGPSGHPETSYCYPEQWVRLGRIMRPRGIRSRLPRTRRARTEDRWWPLHEKPARMERRLRSVLQILWEDGLEWLSAHDTLEAFHLAESELARRKRQREAERDASPSVGRSETP